MNDFWAGFDKTAARKHKVLGAALGALAGGAGGLAHEESKSKPGLFGEKKPFSLKPALLGAGGGALAGLGATKLYRSLRVKPLKNFASELRKKRPAARVNDLENKIKSRYAKYQDHARDVADTEKHMDGLSRKIVQDMKVRESPSPDSAFMKGFNHAANNHKMYKEKMHAADATVKELESKLEKLKSRAKT